MESRNNVKPSDVGINYNNQSVSNNNATLEDYNKKGFPNIGADFGAQLGQLFPQNPAMAEQPFFQHRKVGLRNISSDKGSKYVIIPQMNIYIMQNFEEKKWFS